MILTKGLTRLGAAVGLFALVLGLSAALASTASRAEPSGYVLRHGLGRRRRGGVGRRRYVLRRCYHGRVRRLLA